MLAIRIARAAAGPNQYSRSVPTPTGVRLALAGLRMLPLHALSRAAGGIASLRLPGPLQRAEIRLFGALTGVDFHEAGGRLESFSSLQEFFTRPLRKGVRTVDPADDAVVAPCDGSWGASGTVERGTLLQVKGRPYSLAALLGSEAEAKRFEGGAFATLYLSPRDYHRFHMPCAARVVRARYLPGSLWPVNRLGVEGIPGLFAENERLCAHFEVGEGEGARALCLVAVGATLVGKVRVRFDDLSTHTPGREGAERSYGDRGPRFAKGEELGRFEFGSSLVLLAERGLLELRPEERGLPVRLGTRIGTLQG